MFILQQRSRPIGSDGSSSNSGLGHSSGDSNNTSTTTWNSSLDKKRNPSPVIENRSRAYNSVGRSEGKLLSQSLSESFVFHNTYSFVGMKDIMMTNTVKFQYLPQTKVWGWIAEYICHHPPPPVILDGPTV